jgi:hypothetical protein
VAVTAFSHFSAASELLVTAAVFYVLWRAWRHDDVRTGLLGVVLTFELFVNIAYMAIRTATASHEIARTPFMSTLLAIHGSLSLLMFVALVGFAFEAARLRREGRNAVRERPKATLAFVAFWTVSILSGEAIYLTNLVG